MSSLFELLSGLVKVDGVLLVVRSGGAVSEIRSDSLGVRQGDRWITVGPGDGPAHMHVDPGQIRSAGFVLEERSGRTSYSVRFYDGQGDRVLAAFFTGMYDEAGNVDPGRKRMYDELNRRFGPRVEF